MCMFEFILGTYLKESGCIIGNADVQLLHDNLIFSPNCLDQLIVPPECVRVAIVANSCYHLNFPELYILSKLVSAKKKKVVCHCDY